MFKKWGKFIVSGVLIFGLTATFSGTTQAANKELAVHFINVGQGDSIYLKTPTGEDFLIDGGANGQTVVNYLRSQKVKDLEGLISTHPDADHLGGLDEVLNQIPVKAVYAPKVGNTTKAYRDFLNAVKRKKLKIKAITKGVKLPTKSVQATFIGPVKNYSQSDTNDWSAVLKVTYQKKSFLFTGDAENKAERDLINSRQNLKADVLKVAHHGADGATSSAFLQKVKPSKAIISVGKNNYGHPGKSALGRLNAAKASVYRTDKVGTIVFKTNGSNLLVNKKASSAPKPTPAKAKPATYHLKASLNNRSPKQYSTIILNVTGLPKNTPYQAVAHYKSKNTTYRGKVGQKLPLKISRSAKKYKVKIDVTSRYKNKTYRTQTYFTAR